MIPNFLHVALRKVVTCVTHCVTRVTLPCQTAACVKSVVWFLWCFNVLQQALIFLSLYVQVSLHSVTVVLSPFVLAGTRCSVSWSNKLGLLGDWFVTILRIAIL